MQLTYTFPGCWLHVNEDAHFLSTVFHGGRALHSIPDCAKDPATAEAYGYRGDIHRLWREHDLLHHTIGTLFGLGMSTTLWSVVHEDSPEAIPQWARVQEERFIGHVHRWLNLNEWHEELWPLRSYGYPLPALRRQFLRILSGQILDVTRLHQEGWQEAAVIIPPAPPVIVSPIRESPLRQRVLATPLIVPATA